MRIALAVLIVLALASQAAALDTREKRQSAIAITSYYMGPSVTPNAPKDNEWRQQVGYGYSGVETDPPGGVTAIVPQAYMILRGQQ